MQFLPHEQRVIDEHRELSEKINKLVYFFENKVFSSLPESEQMLLRAQREFMTGYRNILSLRIDKFIFSKSGNS